MLARDKLRMLREDADKASSYHGHKLKWSEERQESVTSRMTQHGDCQHCPAWVHIDTHPMPNGIGTGGPAVAMNCPANCTFQFGHKEN